MQFMTLRVAHVVIAVLLFSCSGRILVPHQDLSGGINEVPVQEITPIFFLLGDGDEVSVKVWRHDDLSRTVTLDRSGSVYLPLAGP